MSVSTVLVRARWNVGSVQEWLKIHPLVHSFYPISYCLVCLSVYLFSCCSHLEHRASVKRFVSLQLLDLGQSIGLLREGISSSQGRDLHRTTQTNIHALSGVRTHVPGCWAGEDISWLRLRDHCDRLRSFKQGRVYPCSDGSSWEVWPVPVPACSHRNSRTKLKCSNAFTFAAFGLTGSDLEV
jgi:hypothetical protein